MFGSNKFKKVKTKTFKSDNERKKYFAIKNYYTQKSSSNITIVKNKKKTNSKSKKM